MFHQCPTEIEWRMEAVKQQWTVIVVLLKNNHLSDNVKYINILQVLISRPTYAPLHFELTTSVYFCKVFNRKQNLTFCVALNNDP